MNEPTRPEHEHLRDELAAYSLGALGDAESQTLEAHLAECESCREWLRWLRPAVDVLPATVEQHAPPESLRDKLMAIVQAEAEQDAEPARSARRFRLADWSLRPAVTLAAVAALLVGGVATGYLLRGEEEVGPTFVEADVPAALVNDVSATLERSGDSAILHVDEMPPVGGDEVYEVWVQHGERTVPASLFVPDRNGSAEAAIASSTSVEGADAVLVTREPRGGTSRPTGAPLLRVPLN